MNVVILNTAELTGGAAVAANRLMKALNRSGANVSMLVRDQKSRDPRVVSINNSNLREKFNFMRFVWERLVIFLSFTAETFVPGFYCEYGNRSQLPSISPKCGCYSFALD